MEERRRLVPAKVWGTTLAILLTGAAGVARAQAADAPPPAAPAAPPAAPAEAPPPPPPAVVVAPPATPPAAVATEAKPPTSAEAMPATRPDVLPPIDVGAWLRAGGTFQGARSQQDQRLAHGQRLRGAPRRRQDHQERRRDAEPERQHHQRQRHVHHGLQRRHMDGSPPGSGNFAALEDAIISFDFVDEFHLWAGHLLVPVDRSNASGPFFMIPWNYPGFFAAGNGVRRGAEGRAVGTQQRRRRLGRHPGRQVQLLRRRVRQRPGRHQPAVFREVAPGAPRPGAGVLGQRQLLR